MNQRTTAYLTMTSATLRVLANYETEWSLNKPAERQVLAIRSSYAATQAAQQGSNTVTTGVTDDKEAAGDAAIEKAVLLAGYAQAYALEQNNLALYEQMRVSFSQLDRLPDEALAPRLYDLHQRMNAIAPALEEYGVTPAELAALQTAILKFEGVKSAPRITITGRKGHNDSLPEMIRSIRTAFSILDKLVKNWENSNPEFVRNYENARNVIDRGSRNGDAEIPPAKTDM